MQISVVFARTVSCLLLLSAPFGRAQGCAGHARDTVFQQQSHVVSARALLIPPKAWRFFENARSAVERGQPEIADRETARALALAPRFAEVYLLRAVEQLHAGRAEAAIENVAIARGIEADLPWSSVVVASALNQLRRYDQVLVELEHARGAEVLSWQFAYERARAETGRHNLAAALHWSELAVGAAPPGCTEARLVHANALHLAGRQTEVVAELEAYLAEDRQGRQHAEVQHALQAAQQEISVSDGGLVAMK